MFFFLKSVKKCCPENEVLDIHYKTCNPVPQNSKLGYIQNITFPLLPLDEHGQIPSLSIPFNGRHELNCPVGNRLLYNGSVKSSVLFSKDTNPGNFYSTGCPNKHGNSVTTFISSLNSHVYWDTLYYGS